MSQNLFDRLVRTAQDIARKAIENVDGTVYSYGDLFDLAGRLANVLVAQGVMPGDRVAVQVEKSVPALMIYLATLRAGAVYLPLNTAYTLAELEYFIGDSEPSLVICDPATKTGMNALAAKVGARVLTLDPAGHGELMDAAGQAPAAFATIARNGDDLAAIRIDRARPAGGEDEGLGVREQDRLHFEEHFGGDLGDQRGR